MASATGARQAFMFGNQAFTENQPKLFEELGKGYQGATDLLNTGYGLSQDWMTKGLGVYNQMQGDGQAGLDRYKALTTGDGASQQAALEQTPGYQFSMDQGLQALNRRRAAGGMLNSGNADADAIQFGSGLASQTLGAERAAQMPLMNLYSQGAQGVAGAYNGLAGLAQQNYGTQAGLTNDLYTGRANIMDDTTKNIVGLYSQASQAKDQAKSQNQANAVNTGLGVAKLALGAFTGGASSPISGFTSLFK